MRKADKAVSCFKDGFSCSQAIFSAYGRDFGIDDKTAMKIASAFGGGMARMGETCGAVTGAFMVIGLAYAVDKNSKDKVYSIVREFVDAFEARHGAIVCKELLGYDMRTPEGMHAIKEKKLIDAICPKLVRDAAEILEEILAK